MLRFDSNEIGWICCYLLRILFLLLLLLFLLDNGRLLLPLRPYLFYPPQILLTQSIKIHLFILSLMFHLYVACIVVCFHIINIKIWTQTDVSKIRSTGNKEQNSQNVLLQRKKDAVLCVFLFWRRKKGEFRRSVRKTLSAIIF